MWYVVWTRTGQEESLKELCERRIPSGCYEECFIPKSETERKIAGKLVKQQKILFPGYLFFQSDYPEELMKNLKKLPGFTRLLGNDHTPQPLYPHEEEWLKTMVDGEMIIRMSRGYMVGDELIVTDGPLKNFKGKLAFIDRHKRAARLEMEFFGEKRQVWIGLEVTKKISGGKI